MIAAVRAEFRKILTVRSTYGIMLLSCAVGVLLTAFWIYGYKDVQHAGMHGDALLSSLYQTMSISGIFLSFLALLSVGHEYRYDTILYAMTTNNRRSKIFFAKLFAVIVTALAVAAVLIALGYVAFFAGQHLHHLKMVHQTMPDWGFVWHSLVTVAGSQGLAFMIAMLVRSQIMSIAVFLIMPTFIEGLLSLLLKDNAKYLPFTAIGNVSELHPAVAYTSSALVIAAYVVGLGVTAWLLFLRRDAN